MSKPVNDEPTSSQAEPLKWEVFVTPGIPIAQAQRPEGVQETYFQAMASTLIYGKTDAILVDAFMTVKQATALADWVASKHKNLTTILRATRVVHVGLPRRLTLTFLSSQLCDPCADELFHQGCRYRLVETKANGSLSRGFEAA